MGSGAHPGPFGVHRPGASLLQPFRGRVPRQPWSRCPTPPHPGACRQPVEVVVSVVQDVREELGDYTGWRASAALALAAQVDATGSASAARELRALMTLIEDEGAKAGDELDEFRRARDAARGAG